MLVQPEGGSKRCAGVTRELDVVSIVTLNVAEVTFAVSMIDAGENMQVACGGSPEQENDCTV